MPLYDEQVRRIEDLIESESSPVVAESIGREIRKSFIPELFEVPSISSLSDLERRVEALEKKEEDRERMDRLRVLGFVFPGDKK